MKIRSLINILVAVSLTLLALTFARLYASTQEFSRHDDDAMAVQKLTTDISNLRFILIETILYRESRSQKLWRTNLQRMRADLRRHQYSLPAQNALVGKILGRQAAIDVLYARLALNGSDAPFSADGMDASHEIFARTTNALLVATQEILDDSAEINRLNREVMLSVSNRRQIVSLIVVSLFALIGIVFWVLIKKSVLVPISQFQSGTELIADGDLSYRLGMKPSNEIGNLARTFDAMTAQLQQSVADLQSEIAERKAIQQQLAQYADQLAQDLAARKLAEEGMLIAQAAAERSESRLRQVMNSAYIGIVACDYSGHFLDVNDTFLELSGYSRPALLSNETTWQAMASEKFYRMLQHAQRELLASGKAASIENTLIRADGAEVPILMGLAKLDGSDQEWVGFVLDLSERYRVERLKSEFISVVSHELRTPLTSIRGTLGLLEGGMGGELSPQAFKLIQVAHANSKRLGGLVNNILDMDKLLSGKMSVMMKEIELVALARQAMEANAVYGAMLQVNYVLHAHSETAWIHGDQDRLMQVFANLLSNAAKFSAPGQQVEINVAQKADVVRVEIVDHGSGIPLAFRSRIFEAFSQANSSDTRRQGGTGLGLKITKALIEEMNGEIGFDSVEGAGTTFWFELAAAKMA